MAGLAKLPKAISLEHFKERHQTTAAQEMLLNMLDERFRKRQIFTIADLRRVYATATRRRNLNPAHPEDMNKPAIDWLHRNIGSCTLKGRMLVLPIISKTIVHVK